MNSLVVAVPAAAVVIAVLLVTPAVSAVPASQNTWVVLYVAAPKPG